MAYCLFSNCLSIIGSGITPYTSLDSRSGVPLTSNGQMAFFGSSDNSGPLGMVFQHINANGICRADITATRYGISGNDLSLNIDSTNPTTTGGMLIKYGGGVAIGTGQPCGALDVYKQGAGSTNSGDILIVRGGNNANLFGTNQIRFGYAGGTGYSHAIKTRHQSGSPGNNALDFFTWTPSDAIETVGTKLVMTLDGTGNVGIGTCAPTMPLTFVDGLGGKILLNANANNYSIGLASGVVSADASMKFTAGCITPGDITFYRGSSLSMIITCVGNIGVGTSSPSSRLDVCGADGRIQSRVDSSDGSTINVRPNAGKCGWVSYTEDAVADRWGIGIKNGDAKLYFASGNVGVGGGTTRMVLDGSGNIGIGTTSPGVQLSIEGTGTGSGLQDGQVQIRTTTAANPSAIGFVNSGCTNSFNDLAWIRAIITSGCAKGSLSFVTRNSEGNNTGVAERMRITNDGYVSIGCSTPSTKFQVAGGLKSTGTTELVWFGTCDATQPLVLTFKAVGGATSSDRGMQIVSTEAGLGGNFLDINETSTRTRFFSNGNVNIGSCATTSYRLNVNGSFYSAGSSCEYKTSICNYNTDSCMFMKLKPVTYQYKDEWCHLGKELKSGTQIGLIAEHTAEVFPELAILKEEENEKVVRNVDYEKLSIVLLAEVQKLRQEVDQLKNK